jgi:hypothetical protein
LLLRQIAGHLRRLTRRPLRRDGFDFGDGAIDLLRGIEQPRGQTHVRGSVGAVAGDDLAREKALDDGLRGQDLSPWLLHGNMV